MVRHGRGRVQRNYPVAAECDGADLATEAWFRDLFERLRAERLIP